MTGQFVISRAGHDKGTLYVVLAEDERYVYLSEGRLKSPDKPKKKNRRHVQPVNAADPDLQAGLAAGGTVRPEEIRAAIKQFTADQSKEG